MTTTARSKWTSGVVLASLVAFGLASPAAAVFPADCPDRDTYNHFPRVPVGGLYCAEETGRMAALAGSAFRTLERGFVSIKITVPGTDTEWELGVFDGDTGELDMAGVAHWDAGTTELGYNLFVDPTNGATIDPEDEIGMWIGNMTGQDTSGVGWTASHDYFPDNDWWVLSSITHPSALGLDGNYHYHLLMIYDADPGTPDNPVTVSDFRLRGKTPNAQIAFSTTEFAFEGAVHGAPDVQTVYPDWDGVIPGAGSTLWNDFVAAGQTTNDGKWEFFATLPALTSLELFDGDFDYGNLDSAGLDTFPSALPLAPCALGPDTDDTDSFLFPNATDDRFPSFVTIVGTDPIDGKPVGDDESKPQEAIVGGGDPTDNSRLDVLRREPCVTYRLIDPTGRVFENFNPSAQREWEQFRICSANAINPTLDFCDHVVPDPVLPAGTWKAEIEGMDLSNLNTWRLDIQEAVDACLVQVEKTADPEYLSGVGGNHEVTYTYVVTNNADPLIDVDLVDDKLGVIASDFTLAPGESRTFTRMTDIFVTTTNVATVDGVTAFGTMCTAEATATVTVGDDECPPDLDFEFDPAGDALFPGQIIDDEFAAMGITVTTHDPVNHPAMIFGSDSPTGGDWDLGTPNETFGGPGIGGGGEAGMAGENALAHGNVLIISEDGDPNDPDDNTAPGALIFTFAVPVRLDAVDILDLDESTVGTVTAFNSGGGVVGSATAEILGDNSFQTVYLGAVDVSRLEVALPGSGAIGTIYFCLEESVCLPTLDFDQDAAGNALTSGQIIDDEFSEYGVQVSTNDPVNHPVMIFDSAAPTGGDFDLGTPNETFGGPGVGSGGEAGQPGENATGLGKLLIISEDGDSGDPDDNVNGGTIAFDFDQPVELASVGIVDIDNSESMGTVTAFDGFGGILAFADMLPLGDNSYQSIALPASGVRRLEIMFPKSGAVSEIVFCVEDVPCTPTTVGDNFDQVSWGNNDGSDDWAGNWVEDDAAGSGPGSGNVRIYDGRLKLEDYPNTGTMPSLARTVDLSDNPNFATLTFDFWTTSGVDWSDSVKLEISTDGGGSWTLLENFTEITGATSGSRSYNITSFASAQTTIRFKVAYKYGGSNEYFKVDHLQIASGCEGECDAGLVRDEFNQVSYSGNDGLDNWVGDWIEDDPVHGGEGPSAGNVRVYRNKLKLDDYPNTGGYPSARRTVDLTGYDLATLTFDYWTTSGVDPSDAVAVEVSPDGGATWDVLHTYTGIDGAFSGAGTYDISGFISAQTVVRFRITNLYGGRSEYFKVDNVEVSYSTAICGN